MKNIDWHCGDGCVFKLAEVPLGAADKLVPPESPWLLIRHIVLSIGRHKVYIPSIGRGILFIMAIGEII